MNAEPMTIPKRRRSLWSRWWFWTAMILSLPFAYIIPLWAMRWPYDAKLAEFNRHLNDAMHARYGPDISRELAKLTTTTVEGDTEKLGSYDRNGAAISVPGELCSRENFGLAATSLGVCIVRGLEAEI